MKNRFTLIILLFAVVSCKPPGQQAVTVISAKADTSKVAKIIKYKGKIDTAIRFVDKDGEHMLLTSEDNQFNAENRINGIFLYAYCYHIINGKWKLTWQLHDLVSECDFDVAGGFIPKAISVTDLNRDGQAEVWLMYWLACRSDVSPGDMKVIMHEDATKFAMRGATRVKINATDYYGGDFKFDTAFTKGPQSFRKYAQQLWEVYRNEN